MKLAVVLDNIRSAHNVGSIFRTADALGVEKLYLCGITPKPGGAGVLATSRASRDIAKTALGAEKTVVWEYCRRFADAVKKLRCEGFCILALEQDTKAVDIRNFKLKKQSAAAGKSELRIALVLGPEVAGLPHRALALCDTIVQIPMFGAKESLNVSVAFGVAGYWMKFGSFSS